ncbi:aspartate dehydrogenase domain-containing protein-like [Liolophura sinensis]|uniref:aspartate dehydrogenase domain-containing protein-like n=1 Tax=Liolophura sinensis TaxID=3198878 RepID=UPI0031583504
MWRIGIVGYGHLGQYLVDAILENPSLELAFVWNRSKTVFEGKVKPDYILEDLSAFRDRKADLIIEVAHPGISFQYGAEFLTQTDYMVGSPTALASAELEGQLRSAAVKHGLYIPVGALWGADDVQKMAQRGTLQALKITMKKHPSSFKLEGELKIKNDEVKSDAVVLFDGPVRELCPLAPNNVNTMAVGAMAASNLGFDKVQGSLVSDPSLTDYHIVEVDVWGPGDIEKGTAFHCHTVRTNPAKVGAVTGSATYASFLSSMLRARGKGPGVHFC